MFISFPFLLLSSPFACYAIPFFPLSIRQLPHLPHAVATDDGLSRSSLCILSILYWSFFQRKDSFWNIPTSIFLQEEAAAFTSAPTAKSCCPHQCPVSIEPSSVLLGGSCCVLGCSFPLSCPRELQAALQCHSNIEAKNLPAIKRLNPS